MIVAGSAFDSFDRWCQFAHVGAARSISFVK